MVGAKSGRIKVLDLSAYEEEQKGRHDAWPRMLLYFLEGKGKKLRHSVQ